MKIPKKISPDRIREAIVELRYNSKVPYEVVVGIFFQALDDTYEYTNRPLEKKAIQSQIPALGDEVTLRLGILNLFYKDNIKIQLQPGSIIFNCVNEYITWPKYKPEIAKVIQQVLKAGIIKHFTRIGVRYISDYENINLTDCVNFNFAFGMPQVQSNEYTFHTEFISDEIRVILNLGNKIPRHSKESNSMIPVSSIDIDTILDISKMKETENIMSLIDKVHDKEKEIFFALIKNEFLKTLNIEY